MRSSNSPARNGPSAAGDTKPPGPPTLTSRVSAPVTQNPSGTRYARHSRPAGTPAGPSSSTSALTSTNAAPGHGAGRSRGR